MTKPYSDDLRTRGRGELPRGGTTVQHRREQRGAASEAVSADGGVAAKLMRGGRNSRLKDERGDIVLIDNSPLAQERQSQGGNRGREGRIAFPAAHLVRSE